MIEFNNTGISSTPTKSGRSLVYTDIIYSGNTYHWTIYVPTLSGITLSEYLTNNSAIYEADIKAKEALWLTVPHTEEIFDPMTNEVRTVDIPKERVVCATIPDYIEMTSDINLDIPAIKRLLQILTTTLLTVLLSLLNK